MTLSAASCRFSAKRRGGFTLVEVLVGATLGAMILTGVLAAYLMLVKSGMRTSNYSLMETETRLAFGQLGIDARMANGFTSHFSGGVITSFTLHIPNTDPSGSPRDATYVYDTSDPTNKKLVLVPGTSPSTITGRKTLVSNVTDLTFLRYSSTAAGVSTLIPAGIISDASVKHIQISISVSRGGAGGLAAATQVIRSTAFTLRNILHPS